MDYIPQPAEALTFHFYIAFYIGGFVMDAALIRFLQRFLRDALALNFNYFTWPFSDISSADLGLRKGLKDSELLYGTIHSIMENLETHTFTEYCDRYLLHYILFRPYEDKKDVTIIGPFLKTAADQEYMDHLIQIHHLNHNEAETVGDLLNQIPVFDNNMCLISILYDLIDYIVPLESDFDFKELAPDIETVDIPYVPVDDYMLNVKATEKLYALEKPLLTAVSKGNVAEALELSRQFMSMIYAPRINDPLHDKKNGLISTNTLLRLGAEMGHVHPIFVHELSGKHVKLINQTSSITQLNKLHEKIIRNYCLLVQNKSRMKYSKLIKDALNYIDFNLSGTLTLSALADYFHVSAPYFSRVFKKELNMTVTDYVTSQRIHESLRLLSSTNMQIQEIAAYVGMIDFNYYTRTFRKCIGCTPREYRKNLRK